MEMACLTLRQTTFLRSCNNYVVLRPHTPSITPDSTGLPGANHFSPFTKDFRISNVYNRLPPSHRKLHFLLDKRQDSFFVDLVKQTRTSDLTSIRPVSPPLIRLAPYLQAWSLITSDSWVLDIVANGYRIEFVNIPPPNAPVFTHPSITLQEEISSLFQKDAIEQVMDHSKPGFHSRYFTVPKKDGGLRPILDLRDLNLYIAKKKFRMTSLDTVIPCLQSGDWFVVIDLKDAYFHISIAPSHRHFLRFAIQQHIYQFKSLPFGLSTAPRVFTKCMAPVIAYLRLQHIMVFPYLDDWLLVAPSSQQASRDTHTTLSLLQSLGLQINTDKSILTPSQVIPYIGAILDSKQAKAFLPLERITNISNMIQQFVPHAALSAHTVQKLLGLMASTTATVPHARLKMRYLQMWYLLNFNPLTQHPQTTLVVPPSLPSFLTWWDTPHNLSCGRPFATPHLSIQITTDASNTGWGAHCRHLKINGLWLPQERQRHINQLEMLAVIKALRAFEPLIVGRHVLLITDNTSVMYYVNKQGGTHSIPLLRLTLHLWEWCYTRKVFLHAVHVASQDNSIADALSRQRTLSHEWELNQSVFLMLCSRWLTPQIDVFASPQNAKCSLFCTRAGRGTGSLGDAFTLLWSTTPLYIFPPLPLILRTVLKVRQDQSECILITPWWPRQPWFPLLLRLASEHLSLPVQRDLISMEQGLILHPDLKSLRLTAWRISHQ